MVVLGGLFLMSEVLLYLDQVKRDTLGGGLDATTRKVDIMLPGKGDSKSMAQGRSTEIISTITWIRTRRSSIKNSLSL